MKLNRGVGICTLVATSAAAFLTVLAAEFCDRLTQRPRTVGQRAVVVEVVAEKEGPNTEWVVGEGIASAVIATLMALSSLTLLRFLY